MDAQKADFEESAPRNMDVERTQEKMEDRTSKAQDNEMKEPTEQEMVQEELMKKFLRESDALEYAITEDIIYPLGHRNAFHSWVDKYMQIVSDRKAKEYANMKTKSIVDAVDNMLGNLTTDLENARQCKNSITNKDISYQHIMEEFISEMNAFNKTIDEITSELLDMYNDFDPNLAMQKLTAKDGERYDLDDTISDLQQCFFLKHLTNKYFKIEREAEHVKDNRKRRLSFKAHKLMTDAMHSAGESFRTLGKKLSFTMGKKSSEEEKKNDQEKNAAKDLNKQPMDIDEAEEVNVPNEQEKTDFKNTFDMEAENVEEQKTF